MLQVPGHARYQPLGSILEPAAKKSPRTLPRVITPLQAGGMSGLRLALIAFNSESDLSSDTRVSPSSAAMSTFTSDATSMISTASATLSTDRATRLWIRLSTRSIAACPWGSGTGSVSWLGSWLSLDSSSVTRSALSRREVHSPSRRRLTRDRRSTPCRTIFVGRHHTDQQ